MVEVCVGDTAQVTCTAFGPDLAWLIGNCFESFTKTSDVGLELTGCDFVMKLVSKTTSSLVSTATLSNVEPTHNGTVLTCYNTLILTASDAEMANVTIIVPGIDLCIYSIVF